MRSFLGLVNFSAKFLPHLATVAEPLRQCLHSDSGFVWGKAQVTTFSLVKTMMSKAETLALFENDRETTVVADASPVGLGAVLLQKHGDLLWPVIFASRSLSKDEQRYSQTEKEALALVWACERFSLFLLARRFRLITDHKRLEIIYGPKSKPSAIIERWVLRLQSYHFDVSYQPGKTNIADPLSRLSTSTPAGDTEGTYIKCVATAAAPCTITPKDIERASNHDEELTSMRDAVQNANRDAAPAP